MFSLCLFFFFFPREAAGLECVCLCFPERHYAELPQPLLVHMRPFLKLLPRRHQRLEINTAWSSERLYLFNLTWLIHRKFSLSSRINKNTLQQFSFVVWEDRSSIRRLAVNVKWPLREKHQTTVWPYGVKKNVGIYAAKHWWSYVFVGFNSESVIHEVLITLVQNELDIIRQFLNSVRRRFHWLKTQRRCVIINV